MLQIDNPCGNPSSGTLQARRIHAGDWLGKLIVIAIILGFWQ